MSTPLAHTNILVARRDDINNYFYLPSLAGAIISCIIFSFITILLSLQIRRYRVRYPLILAIGAGCEALGYLFRSLSASNHRETSFTLFLLMDMFVILSPLAFMAGLYIIYGRLVRRLTVIDEAHHSTAASATEHDGAPRKVKFSFIPPHWYARLFVSCDVTSFLIQAAGAGLIVSSDATTATLGKNILMAGLAFGFATFSIFVSLILYSNVLVTRYQKQGTFRGLGLTTDWRLVMVPMLFSSACIIARTLYRIIEFADGYNGHIYTTEWYLYVFDTTLMVLCIGIWIPMFPARYGLDQTLTGVPSEQMGTVQETESGNREKQASTSSRASDKTEPLVQSHHQTRETDQANTKIEA